MAFSITVVIICLQYVSAIARFSAQFTDFATSDSPCNFQGTIKVGGTQSISPYDRFYSYGASMSAAFQLAVKQVNSERCGVHVNGQNLSLSVRVLGDESNATLLKRLYSDLGSIPDIKYLLGPYSSGLTLASSDVAQASGKITIASGGANPRIYKGKDKLYGMLPQFPRYRINIYDALAKKGAKTVAFVREYGYSQCAPVEEQVDKFGMIVVNDTRIPKDGSVEEFSQIAASLKSTTEPDVILVCGYIGTCVNWTKALRLVDFSPAIVTSGCSAQPAYREQLGEDSQYVLVGYNWLSTLNATDPVLGWTAEEYNEIHTVFNHQAPSYQAAAAAASISLLVQAIEAAQSLDTEKVQKQLDTRTFETLYGTLQFDDQGQRSKPSTAVQFDSEGNPQVVYPPEEASRELVYPIPTWSKRDCNRGNNCSFHGECKDDGSCECYDGFVSLGDKCIAYAPEEKHLNRGIQIACLCLFGINFLIIVALFTWTVTNWNSHVVKAAQRLFLLFVLLGALISSSTIVAIALTDTDIDASLHGHYLPANIGCMAIVWLYTTGFMCTFTPLFCKLYRIGKILNNSKLRVVKISNGFLFRICASLVMIDWVIVLTWTLVDPLIYDREPIYIDGNNIVVESSGTCRSDNAWAFIAAILVVHVTVLIVGMYFCIRTRNINSILSESKFISIALVSNLEILALAIPVLVLVYERAEASMIVRSGVIFLNDLGILLLVFVPKVKAWRENWKFHYSKSDPPPGGPDTRKLIKNTSGLNTEFDDVTESRPQMSIRQEVAFH